MITWPPDIKHHAKNLLHLDDPLPYFSKYAREGELNGLTFVMVDKPCDSNFKYINNQCQFGKYRICNLGNYDNAFVLLPNLFCSNPFGFGEFGVVHLVSLDSNIISKLPRYFTYQSQDENLNRFVEHFINSNINICGFPYLMEDSLNSSGMQNKIKVYDCMRYYALFRRLTNSTEDDRRELQVSDHIDADEMFSIMNKNRNCYIDDEIQGRGIYCFLLKTYIIQFSSNKSAKNKLVELIDFMNNEMGFFFEYGTVLAYLFFKKDDEIIKSYFQKVQPNSKKRPLMDIEGMAWDIFHVVDAPVEMAVHSKQLSCVALQSLATEDDALANIISFNPLERLVFYGENALAKYKYSLSSVIDDPVIIEHINMNKSKREQLLPTINWTELKDRLELELLSILGISK